MLSYKSDDISCKNTQFKWCSCDSAFATGVTMRFSNATKTVSEVDETVTVTIMKEGDSQIPVTVELAMSDKTATGK